MSDIKTNEIIGGIIGDGNIGDNTNNGGNSNNGIIDQTSGVSGEGSGSMDPQARLYEMADLLNRCYERLDIAERETLWRLAQPVDDSFIAEMREKIRQVRKYVENEDPSLGKYLEENLDAAECRLSAVVSRNASLKRDLSDQVLFRATILAARHGIPSRYVNEHVKEFKIRVFSTLANSDDFSASMQVELKKMHLAVLNAK